MRVTVLALTAALATVLAPATGLLGEPERAIAATTAAAARAEVVLRSVTPALVTPQAELVVAVTVRNPGSEPLETVSVRLRLLRDQLGVRDEVERWLDAGDPREGLVTGGETVLDQPLAPGGQRDVTLRLPGSALGLTGRPFGAYGLGVEVRATAGGVRDRVALRRTTLQWQGGVKEYAAQQLGWVVPFTGLPGSAPDDLTVRQVADAVGPGSRLRHLLDAASEPGVGWAVDPALLLTLQRAAQPTAQTGASTPTAPATETPADIAARAVVRTYLADLRAAAPGREVLELPYADPDVDALARAKALDLLSATRAAAAGVVEQTLGVQARTDVAVPPGGRSDDAGLTYWRRTGSPTVVLDGASRPLVDALPYTVDARAQLPRQVVGVLSDPELSGLLTSLSRDDVGAAQHFLAETAAATSELPGTSRRMLVLAPETLDPDPSAFRALVKATASVPWLGVTTAAASAQPAANRFDTADLPRRVVPATAAQRSGVARKDVAAVRELRSSLSAVAEVVDTPALLTAQAQRSTLELLSAAWRGRHDALVARQRSVADELASSTQGVRVLPSTVNFLTDRGRLQITVSNELDREVHGLRLAVTASNPRLIVQQERSQPETIGPGQRVQVQVPVRALASGEVTLEAQLTAPSGARIGAPEQVTVRVRPTDSWWLTGAGVVVGVVVLLGLVRALLRPRRRRSNPSPEPEVEA
ncbi:DUF6049 family protein [Angustibacter aerolatus]